MIKKQSKSSLQKIYIQFIYDEIIINDKLFLTTCMKIFVLSLNVRYKYIFSNHSYTRYIVKYDEDKKQLN